MHALDDELHRVAGTVDDALAAFVNGAGGFAPGFDATGAGQHLRDLARESEHLAGYVADVGAAFREAETDPDGNGIYEGDDNFISERVGEPTILWAEAAARGQADSAELREQLEAAGINPDEFDPSQLAGLDPSDPTYMELFNTIERIGSNMWDEHYAVGFYDQMNEDGIRALVGVIETFAVHQIQAPTDDDGMPDPAPDLGNIAERLLAPIVHGFAIASGSVDLTEEREALLNPGTDPNSDARWKQHQLAMLLTDEGRYYDPTFLAQAADVILVSNRDVNWINRDYAAAYDTDYPAMYMGPDLWEGRPELGVPQVIAMTALADNDDASWQFTGMSNEHLEVILRPDTDEIQQLPFEMTSNGYSYDDMERLRDMVEQAGADIVTNTFVDAVRDDPSRYSAALDRYADVVRIVGDGEIPGVTKRTVANA
ncbi:MAG: hypothetical protein ACRD0U_05470, partial [Acidimicrobiales bacterium]